MLVIRLFMQLEQVFQREKGDNALKNPRRVFQDQLVTLASLQEQYHRLVRFE